MLTLFLFSLRLPMLPPLLLHSSQASLSHSWIFAVASEFVCFPWPWPPWSMSRIVGGFGCFPLPLEHILSNPVTVRPTVPPSWERARAEILLMAPAEARGDPSVFPASAEGAAGPGYRYTLRDRKIRVCSSSRSSSLPVQLISWVPHS